MIHSIRFILISIIVSTFALADVLITELADPNNNASARFVELHNNGDDVDLSNYKIRRYTNGNAAFTASSEVTLSGTLSSGAFFIICKSDSEFSSVYGATCDLQLSSNVGDSNGDDQIELVDLSGNTLDFFGVAGQDGTGTWHEFEDGRVERNADATSGCTSSAGCESHWTVDGDNGNGDGAQDAPEGYDPGAWIGASSGGDDGGTSGCTDAAECDDSNPCTVDVCEEDGTCSNDAASDGGMCDDGDAGTENDVCVSGTCTGTAVASCDDGVQNQDETDVDCGGVCDACATTSTYDWSNDGTVLGTYGGNISAANVDGVLELTEDPLSGTPQAFIAAVSGLSGGETIEVCVDLMGSADEDAKGRLWGHYFDGDDPTHYGGSASGSSSYGDDWGNWKTECHTWTVADGETGFTLEIRVYSYGDGGVVGVDNLSVTTTGTVHFPEPYVDPCTDVDCSGNVSDCIASSCVDGACVDTYNAVDTVCDDEDAGTENDVCDGAGTCAGTAPDDPCLDVDCSGNVSDCVASSCVDGACVDTNNAVDTVCDDGDDSTSADVCDGAGTCAGTVPANLFFSEYAEGSSNHKYLEIYNASSETVSLSGYAFPNSNNGSDGSYEYWNPFIDNVNLTEEATVAAGDVYVICHGSSDETIIAECDQTHQYLSNGDDGFCLVYGTYDNFEILDCIGDWNVDPGSGWDVAGVSAATQDHTIVRKADVASGNAGDWASSAGTSGDDSEWVVLDQNTWTFIGSHPHDFAAVCDDDTACNYSEEGDCTFAQEGYDCDGNLLVEVTFQVDMSEQTIDTGEYGLDLYVDDPYGYHDMTDDDGDGVWSVTLTLIANATYAYKFKNGEEWEGNFDDLGCGAGDTYGNRTITISDSDVTLDVVCFNSCSSCVVCTPDGNVNGDEVINVADIVTMVSWIIAGDGSESNADNVCVGDINGDGAINVADIVAVVTIIISD